jgi:uncharacterized membrane protein
MKQYIAIGVTVLAGAALLEVALVPGIVIGGAAVLAPSLTRFARRRLLATASKPRRRTPAAQSPSQELVPSPREILPRFALGQAIAKTITYRIIVTTLDFSTNYIVIGELATAAGLSTFNLVAGPLFYLGHEAVWNYLGPDDAVDVPVIPAAESGEGGRGKLTVSRALAKTITFRTIASVVDFGTNYVVVGEVATAALLSATGFVLGPFVYFGHEKAWEYFAPQGEKKLELLPSA